MFAKLWYYFFEYKKTVLLCAITTFCEVLCALVTPLLIINMFTLGIKNHDKNQITLLGISIIVLALLAMMFGILNAYFSAKSSSVLSNNLRKALFSKILHFSESTIDKWTIPSLITRLNNDVNLIQAATLQFMRSIIYATFTLIISLLFILYIKPLFSFFIILGIIFFSIILTLIFHFAIPQFASIQETSDTLNRTTQENIIAQRIIKSFVRYDYEEKTFLKINTKLEHHMKLGMRLMLLIFPLSTLLVHGSTVTLLFLGKQGVFHIGELNSLMAYSMQAFGSLMLLALMSAQIGRAIVSIKRVFVVLETDDKFTMSVQKKITTKSKIALEFHNVSFTYNKQNPFPVLSNISFQLNHGEVLAILGSTGSGKSTLAKLIPRLYQITSGHISLNDVSLENISSCTLRNSISYVPQQNTLFSGTIIDNITCENTSISQIEIENACKVAQIHDFITSLPNGYNTLLDQSGLNLSGGQKQRLCIARALIKKANFLILDDSTSALDKVTEQKVLKNIKNTFQNITIILISQKISTAKFADKILVLDDGKISGLNSHQHLLKSNKIYQEIFISQKGEI